MLLGLDVGTTGAKALLIDDAGAVLASATTGYEMSVPQPLWAEQDPRDWWEASVASIRQVLAQAPGPVAGVGLTGQMHGLVLLDGNGEVLRPCILWNDQRTGAECAEYTERVGAQLLKFTGNPMLPGFTAPKLAWVRNHEPDVYARIAKVLLPKDYLRYRLTGAFFSDVSDASGTSLFDVGERRWSDLMVQAFEIPRAWLPEVTESPVASARVSDEGAAATGLAAGTPVAGGAGDQAAQAVGAGIVEEGVVSVTLGTSGVVFASSDSYRVEPQGRLHAFCHAVPDKWHLMGVMLSAGGSLRWFRDALADGEPYERLTEAAAQVPAGCEGLIFLPYLTGERTPHPDPHARGVFFGLTLRHRRAHLARAVLEGVAFGLRDSLELMRELGVELGDLRVSGGGGRSALWRQILADVFDREIVAVKETEGAAYGAALLAGGLAAPADAGARTEPGAAAATYAELYPRYRALYPALQPEFGRGT